MSSPLNLTVVGTILLVQSGRIPSSFWTFRLAWSWLYEGMGLYNNINFLIASTIFERIDNHMSSYLSYLLFTIFTSLVIHLILIISRF